MTEEEKICGMDDYARREYLYQVVRKFVKENGTEPFQAVSARAAWIAGLYYLNQMTMEDIVGECGCSVATVSRDLKKVRMHLVERGVIPCES